MTSLVCLFRITLFTAKRLLDLPTESENFTAKSKLVFSNRIPT